MAVSHLETLATEVARRAGLAGAPFPTTPEALAAVAASTSEVLGAPFTLDQPFPLAIDRGLARLRPTRGVRQVPLGAAYALGAFWGEWLVRRRGAVWVTGAPLASVPDVFDAQELPGALVANPFSQVARALRDPDDEALWLKADHRRPHYGVLLAVDEEPELSALGPLGAALELVRAPSQANVERALSLLAPHIDGGDAFACRVAYGMTSVFRLNELALGHAQTLTRLAPGADSALCLADARSRARGFSDEDVQLLRPVVERTPAFFEARLRLAYFLGNIGQEDEGVSVLRALAAEPLLDPRTRRRVEDMLREAGDA